MSNKLEFTEAQWNAMIPAIEQIDGGCSSCITSFLRGLKEQKFTVTVHMLEKITVYDKFLSAEEIKDILDE